MATACLKSIFDSLSGLSGVNEACPVEGVPTASFGSCVFKGFELGFAEGFVFALSIEPVCVKGGGLDVHFIRSRGYKDSTFC